MVNHLLETRHPLSSSAVRLCVRPVFRSFLYLLTSLPPYFLFSVHTSKFRIPQVLCLPLLRKHPGCMGILPILELVFNLFRTPYLPAFLAAVLRFQPAERFCRANSYCPVFSFVPFPRKGMDKGPRCCLP